MIKTSSSSNVLITFFLHLSLLFHCLVWFGPWTTIVHCKKVDSNLCNWCRVNAWKMGASLFTLMLSLLLVATSFIYQSFSLLLLLLKSHNCMKHFRSFVHCMAIFMGVETTSFLSDVFSSFYVYYICYNL